MDNPNNDVPIRDAATIVLLRESENGPKILMGQRGAKAVFMPNKYVFPGGRVDESDKALPGAIPCQQETQSQLEKFADKDVVSGLANAAIRELWEETGLVLGAKGAGDFKVADDWAGFYDAGYLPACDRLKFFFRAITPPGRPRRFDARFFLADAAAIDGDLDDFSGASGELSHLHWIGLKDARALELPFVTELVLSEVEDMLKYPDAPRPIPFFSHDDSGPSFKTITA